MGDGSGVCRIIENVGGLGEFDGLNDDEHVVDSDAQEDRRDDETYVGPKETHESAAARHQDDGEKDGGETGDRDA